MGIEHLEPTPATIKELYGNAYCCAYPMCTRPLYKVDAETGHRTLNSRVAHIRARSEGGPRWDPKQSVERNRSAENLLLLCIEHASEIDDHQGAERFPIETLIDWKKKQLAEYDALSEQEAAEAAQASFRPSGIEIHGAVVLGGQGGNAPGAGGGGGGAIGNGARGGDGGLGGKIINYGFIDLKGSNGKSPGAGGGGGGAMGQNAGGGEGGGGGDIVTAWFRAEDLPDTIEIVVGRGGRGGENGGDGEDGGDTSFGNLLIAKAGKAGRGYGCHPSAREVVSSDLKKGLRLSSLHLAQVIHSHHGLLDLLGAHWEYWEVQSVPAEIQWPLACVVSFGQVKQGTALDFSIVVSDPMESRVFKKTFSAVRDGDDARKVAIKPHVEVIQFTAAVAGVWSITVVSGGIELTRLPIEIRIRTHQA